MIRCTNVDEARRVARIVASVLSEWRRDKVNEENHRGRSLNEIPSKRHLKEQTGLLASNSPDIGEMIYKGLGGGVPRFQPCSTPTILPVIFQNPI